MPRRGGPVGPVSFPHGGGNARPGARERRRGPSRGGVRPPGGGEPPARPAAGGGRPGGADADRAGRGGDPLGGPFREDPRGTRLDADPEPRLGELAGEDVPRGGREW